MKYLNDIRIDHNLRIPKKLLINNTQPHQPHQPQALASSSNFINLSSSCQSEINYNNNHNDICFDDVEEEEEDASENTSNISSSLNASLNTEPDHSSDEENEVCGCWWLVVGRGWYLLIVIYLLPTGTHHQKQRRPRQHH